MYMYYLLGYKYFKDLDQMEKYYKESYYQNHNKEKSDSAEFIGFGSLLNSIDKDLRNKVTNKDSIIQLNI